MDALFRTLPGLLEAMEGSEEVRDAFVFAAWRRVAGEQVTERTDTLEFTEGILAIAVEDRSWQRNLETLAPQLLFRLNAALKTVPVKRIEFRIDAVARKKRNATPEADTAALPDDVSDSIDRISNPRLRDAVKGAAANCLARK